MRAPTLILAAALLLFGTASVHAHALLKAATPPVGSTVKAAPLEVAIVFSEAVEPKFSSIEVRNAVGARVDKNDVHTAPDNGKRLIVGLQTVPPGTYKVIWHVTSVDTHKTQGNFKFTVAP
jgi:methionine-rich copper-binding protein CopC